MKDDILRTIYDYYPKDIINDNTDDYIERVEYIRLKSSIKFAEENSSEWNIFLDDLRKETFRKFEIEDWTQLFNHDACYCCRLSYSSIDNVYVTLSINVSIISNYFSIYCSTTKKENGCYSIPEITFDLNNIDAALLVQIRKTIYVSFPRYEEFPVSLVGEIAPDIWIGNKMVGEATFFDCIFTTHVW